MSELHAHVEADTVGMRGLQGGLLGGLPPDARSINLQVLVRILYLIQPLAYVRRAAGRRPCQFSRRDHPLRT